jgi:hypothetical protein
VRDATQVIIASAGEEFIEPSASPPRHEILEPSRLGSSASSSSASASATVSSCSGGQPAAPLTGSSAPTLAAGSSASASSAAAAVAPAAAPASATAAGGVATATAPPAEPHTHLTVLQAAPLISHEEGGSRPLAQLDLEAERRELCTMLSSVR